MLLYIHLLVDLVNIWLDSGRHCNVSLKCRKWSCKILLYHVGSHTYRNNETLHSDVEFSCFQYLMLKHMESGHYMYTRTNLLTYSLTHSRVQNIIWKANCHSACQKISFFLYGTQRLITVFTRARQWSVSWARWIQSTSSHPASLRSIPILPSHLCLSITTIVLYVFHVSSVRATCPAHIIHFELVRVQIMRPLFRQFSTLSCYFLSGSGQQSTVLSQAQGKLCLAIHLWSRFTDTAETWCASLVRWLKSHASKCWYGFISLKKLK